MKKKPIRIIFIILPAIGCIISLIIIYMMFITRYQRETNTIQYDATISYVHISEEGNLDQIEIFTEEYSNSWVISPSIAQHIPNIKELKQGQTVTIGINKLSEDSVNNSSFPVEVVSLRVNNIYFFTISEYNQYQKNDLSTVILSATVGFFAHLGAVVVLAVLRAKRR